MRKLLVWALRLSITVGILYYIFTKISFSEVITSVSSAKVSYVLIAILILVLVRCVAACRMKLLTGKQGMTLSTFQIFEISFATSFYGLFLPAGMLTGGAIRLYKLSKPDNKPAEALASVVFDRMVDTIVLCALGVLFWILDRPSDQGYIGLSLGAILGGLCVFYVLIFDRNISIIPLKGKNIPIKLPLIREKARDKLNKVITSLGRYKNLSRNHFAVILTLSLTYHLFGILALHLLALSINVNVSFITIAWIRSALFILSMLPISISGLGVREGALVFLLTPYGVPAADAVALSFVFLGAYLCLGGIGGLLEARRLFLPDRGKSEKEEVNQGFEGS